MMKQRRFTKKPVEASRFTEYETGRLYAEKILNTLIDEYGIDPHDILLEFIAYFPEQKSLSALYKIADENGISLDI